MELSDSPMLSEEVIAIEDSPKGIAAAKEAGLRCLAVRNSFGSGELEGADWIVDSLVDVDLNTL